MDINQTIEQIIAFRNNGTNPSQIMQSMMMNNTQIGQMKTQIQNMSRGKNPTEFIMQLAKQQGANEQSLQALSQLLCGK